MTRGDDGGFGTPDERAAHEARGERGPRHARQLRHPRRRPAFWGALSVIVLVLVAIVWVGGRAWAAKGELEQVRALTDEAKTAISEGSYEAAVDPYERIREHAARARSMTGDIFWDLGEKVPVLGKNLVAMRQLTEGIDDVLTAVAPLLEVAGDLEPAALAPQDGRVPIEVIEDVGVAMVAVDADLADVAPRIRAIDTAGTLSALGGAHAQLVDLLDSVESRLTDALPIVQVTPELLGADGPRTYVVMFQNNAELRSLGGSATTFAEVTLDNGVIGAPVVNPAAYNMRPHPEFSVIPVSEEFEDIYRLSLGRFIANATLRPSEQTAAQIVQAEWARMYGKDVDGVISMDGGALSALLQVVGPITLSTGDVVDAGTVLPLLFNGVYERFNSGDVVADDAAQGVIYSETVAQTFARLASGQFDPALLFSTMATAAEQNHTSVWFADEAERTVLAGTALAAEGLRPASGAEDVVGVYLNDQVGSKLNYYLASSVTTGTAQCGAASQVVHRVTLSLASTLPPEAVAGLSPSISGTGYASVGLEKGVQRLVTLLYLPPGAQFGAISVGGVAVSPTGNHDEGRPVHVMWVDIPPGGSNEVSFDVVMPDATQRPLVVDVTPTVQGTSVGSAPLDCATVVVP